MLRNGKWANRYEKCIICGKTNRKHEAKGKCSLCYNKLCKRKDPPLVHKYRSEFKIQDIRRTGLLKRCEVCGITKKLVIHHRDCNKENNVINNFVTLCKSCHSRFHIYLRLKKYFESTCLVAPTG